MLSLPWAHKGDGYELLDGSTRSSASSASGSSSPPLYYYPHHDTITATTALRRRQGLTSQTLHIARKNRRRLITIIAIFIVLIASLATLRIIFMPPAYIVLEPEVYLPTLEATLRDRIPLESSSARAELSANLQALREPVNLFATTSSNSSESLVPNTLFSSDQNSAPADWAPMWAKMGFQAKFYNDEEADAWVEREWKGTQVVSAWRDMPRSILRADMLRYLLIILEGGTWSDMDVVPLKHISNWSSDAVPFVRSHHLQRPAYLTGSDTSEESRQPVRAIVSLECAPRWLSLRGALELIGLKPLARHRNLQFVQWTIHFAPHHPIMVDVLRRILETTDIYRTYRIEMERERQRMGWAWEEREGTSAAPLGRKSQQEEKYRIPNYTAPWESIQQQWVWSRGRWRLGWHPTSVEEWTGPAVWTDALVSYIYATTGVRPEELATITGPVQVGDLVILPEDGFNPPKWSLLSPRSVSRVVHLFRGSWKKKVKSGLAN